MTDEQQTQGPDDGHDDGDGTAAAAASGFWDSQPDTDIESSGVWVTDLLPDVDVKVRSYHSPEAERWRRRRMQKQRGLLAAHGAFLPYEVDVKNDIDHLAEVLVLDWRGVPARDGSGTLLPCTPDNVRAVCKAHRVFRENILLATRTSHTFTTPAEAAAGQEAIEGN